MPRSYLGLQGQKLQIAIGIIAGMDFLLFGYDQGVTGGLLTLKSFAKYFPTIVQVGDAWKEMQENDPAAASAQSTRQGESRSCYQTAPMMEPSLTFHNP